jgi:lysophospholipase L1-like esterase
MSLRRIARRSVVALLLALTLAVGAAQPTVGMFADGPPPPHAPAHTVLALGDSVPSGHACDCQPFPQAYGSLLSATTGAPVAVDNQAVSGLKTSGLLSQLQSSDIRSAVQASDVILMTIGANDFGDHHDQVVEGDCGRQNTDCVSDELQSMRSHLAAALARIDTLRQGIPTTVLVTGYWNVFQDGDVARRAYGESGLRASLQLTRRANAAIQSVATAAGARYVDLYQPFEESGRDVTSLMAADGDHPDAAGHALIARTLLDSGLPA